MQAKEIQEVLGCDEDTSTKLAQSIGEMEKSGVFTPSLAKQILAEIGGKEILIGACVNSLYDRFVTPYVNVPGPDVVVHRVLKSGAVFLAMTGYNALITLLVKRANLSKEIE